MGFFSHFFSGSPAHIISNIVFPGITLGVKSIQAGIPVAKSLISQIKPGPPSPQQAVSYKAMYGPATLTQRSVPYGQASYPQYYGGGAPAGGGAFAPSYDFPPPQQPFSEGSPWDFSTTSPAYSPMPSPTYSAPQDRSWEDLISLAPVAASFL